MNIVNYRDPADETFTPIPVLNTLDGRRLANEAGLLLLGVTHVPLLHEARSPCLPVCRGLPGSYHAGILWTDLPP